jgi:hypothetical protein
MIDNQLIEKVKRYRYLGVMFNASVSFSDAKEELLISGDQMYPTLHYHMLK